MKTTIIFGTIAIGLGSAQGTYSAPANLTREMAQVIRFDENIQKISPEITVNDDEEDSENEVTHEVFFGENIQRVINTLMKKD